MKSCREIQRVLLAELAYLGGMQLDRTVESHLEHCTACQGIYPTRPPLRKFLDAWPEIDPDPWLIQRVRGSVFREMDGHQSGLFSLGFFPTVAFATGLAALFAILSVPLFWLSTPLEQAVELPVDRAARLDARSGLASPFSSGDPLLLTDSLTSLNQQPFRGFARGSMQVHATARLQYSSSYSAVVHVINIRPPADGAPAPMAMLTGASLPDSNTLFENPWQTGSVIHVIDTGADQDDQQTFHSL